MTTMTRPADNTIAKKSGVVIPATAAATRETKAKGTPTLASSDTQTGGFVILVLALIGQPIAARGLGSTLHSKLKIFPDRTRRERVVSR
jgi:hypothetical protein